MTKITVNILNNSYEIEVEVTRGEKKILVHYDKSMRYEYSFISPLTGTRFWVTPTGYSSYHQSEHWNANSTTDNENESQNVGRVYGTYGTSRKDAIKKALEMECGYGSLVEQKKNFIKHLTSNLPIEVVQ